MLVKQFKPYTIFINRNNDLSLVYHINKGSVSVVDIQGNFYQLSLNSTYEYNSNSTYLKEDFFENFNYSKLDSSHKRILFNKIIKKSFFKKSFKLNRRLLLII